MRALLPIISIGVHHRPDVMVEPDYLVGVGSLACLDHTASELRRVMDTPREGMTDRHSGLSQVKPPESDRTIGFGRRGMVTETASSTVFGSAIMEGGLPTWQCPTLGSSSLPGLRDHVAGTHPAGCRLSLQVLALVILDTTRAVTSWDWNHALDTV
jgi:hypothetical protein